MGLTFICVKCGANGDAETTTGEYSVECRSKVGENSNCHTITVTVTAQKDLCGECFQREAEAALNQTLKELRD